MFTWLIFTYIADHNIVLVHLKSLKMQYLGNFVYKECFANSYICCMKVEIRK